MRSLESLNNAVGVLHGWDSSMSLDDLDEEALDARIQVAGLLFFGRLTSRTRYISAD